MKKYLQRVKSLLSFAAPVSATQIFNNLANFCSIIFVAKLGKHELAASALATITFITFAALGASFMSAIGILISHKKEKKDYTGISTVVGTGICLSALLGILLASIIWHMPALLKLFGQDPHLISLTVNYFHLAALCIIPILLSKMIEQFYIGTSRPRLALYMSLIKTPFLILLSYGFILGRWGLPQMGLSGLMLAALLIQTFFLIVFMAIFFFTAHKQLHGPFRRHHFFNWDIAIKILKLGTPISLQTGAEIIAMAITTYFMGWFGTDGLAAAQIVNQYVVMAVMIYIGFSQAMAILTSKAYANNNYALIKEYSQTGIALLSLFFIIIAILFIAFPTSLMDLFLNSSHTHHAKIMALGKIFFMIAIVTNYADSLRFLLSGAYRGLHDAKKPMYVGIFCLWGISIGTSYLLGVPLHFGPIGIRAGIGIGIVCATLYLLYDFYQHKLSGISS